MYDQGYPTYIKTFQAPSNTNEQVSATTTTARILRKTQGIIAIK